MNRARRATVARQRRHASPEDPPAALDRAALLRIAEAMLEADQTTSGATLIEPSGEVTYIAAATLRRGGRA